MEHSYKITENDVVALFGWLNMLKYDSICHNNLVASLIVK